MRDSALSKVDRAAHQKAAIPATGERDCPRPWQDEYTLSEWGHHRTPRGLRGILSRPPRGLKLVHCSREEGHNHAERYPAGTLHQRGEELKQF